VVARCRSSPTAGPLSTDEQSSSVELPVRLAPLVLAASRAPDRPSPEATPWPARQRPRTSYKAPVVPSRSVDPGWMLSGPPPPDPRAPVPCCRCLRTSPNPARLGSPAGPHQRRRRAGRAASLGQARPLRTHRPHQPHRGDAWVAGAGVTARQPMPLASRHRARSCPLVRGRSPLPYAP
jgi:hypothetical protein